MLIVLLNVCDNAFGLGIKDRCFWIIMNSEMFLVRLVVSKQAFNMLRFNEL